jgi:hypothetical protein
MAHNQDWREWLESLNASDADFIVVGGIALAHHGIVRYTGDLDVFVRPTPDNAERVIAALRRFGFGSLNVTPGDLAVPDRVIQLGFPPSRIDLLTAIDGVSWDQASMNAEVGEYAGIRARFISRADLILNKRATGRAQDRADADRLDGID